MPVHHSLLPPVGRFPQPFSFLHARFWFCFVAIGTMASISMMATIASADNWPAWRGPTGDGICTEKRAPTTWDRETHVRWRVDLPERGNSTPVVWGNRIFVTQAIDSKNLRTLMCFDRREGRLLWTVEVTYAEKEASHKTNPYCSASPVTDGERVVVWFGSAGLYCYDMNGKEVWHRDLDKQNHIWGYAASPVLTENVCLLNFGPGDREFLLAVDKKTGETVWQVNALSDEEERQLATPGSEGNAEPPAEKAPDKAKPRDKILRGSWSTPILVRAEGRDELVVSHPHRIEAYVPTTGKPLWLCRGLGPLVYSSAMGTDQAVIAMSGYNGAALAVTPGGTGDVTDTRRLWMTQRGPLWLGCGVIQGDHLFISDMRGIAQCIDWKSGEVLWKHRLQGTGGNNATWSSMVLCGDKIYLPNQSGDTFVLRAGPKFELLAKNSLQEHTNTSLAISDGQIFLRTDKSLWCIGD